MIGTVTLKEAEQRVFRTAYDDGLWDLMIAGVVAMLAIAPHLSVYLGDFWSSAVFLPFWLVLYLSIRWARRTVRRTVVLPRVGTVRVGVERVRKLKWLTITMLVINVLALLLGFAAALNFARFSGYVMAMSLGIMLLTGFSLAGYFLGFHRLYLYGVLLVGSPLIGEWLWQKGLATHHGYPVVFGTAAVLMTVWGGSIFVRLWLQYPKQDAPDNEAGA